MESTPFIIERTYDAPIEKVWKAITNKDDMKQWYFDLAEFRAEPGFRFTFAGKTREGQTKIHLCEVTQVIPGLKLAYTWRYETHPGSSEVTFELFPEGSGTRLVLTHTGLESFAALGNSFAKESFAGGWTQLIGTNLPEFLAK